jgi:hypothetical protein
MTDATLHFCTSDTLHHVSPITIREADFCEYFESILGFLLKLYTSPSPSTLARILCEPSEPTTHKLSDFAPYTSAPILAHDEPLFTRGRWKRVIEHKTFGLGTPLYRKTLDNGTPVVVVQYGNIERTLLIDSGHWITPLTSIEKVKTQRVETFTFRDGSPDKKDLYSPRFSHCAQCGEKLVDATGKPTISRFEFCGDTAISSGPCHQAWNETHRAACEIRVEPKSTPYDPAWDKLRAKALEQKFTGFKNFCPNCYEAVVYGPNDTVVRLMKGVYRPQNHRCGITRVEMIPAIKTARKNARKTTREGCNDRRQGDIQCIHHRRYDDVKPGKEMEGGVELPEYFEKHVSTIGGFNAIVKLETALLKVNCKGRADSRAYELWATDQSERQIPKTNISCQHCGTSTPRRKGSKFCSDNCRKKTFRVRVVQ